MNHKIFDIDKGLQAYRSGLATLLQKISQLVVKTKNSDLIKTVEGLKYSIDKPFMFVVIGEVKAGKSSFINALLETEVCATDVKPCTDRVQVLNYARRPSQREVNSNLVEIGKPIEILRETSIVDTPGTNAVIKNHQLITEDFIPKSDLVFFVLFAKNPYFASTWDFLDFVSSKWLRKVVFILQQADLLRSEELLAENISEVKKLAENRGIQSPIVFATSAELEFNHKAENSGFDEVRNYIKSLITTKETYQLKLKNSTNTTKIIIQDLNDDIEILRARLKSDQELADLVKSRFERGRNQSASEVELTVKRVSERYSSIAGVIREEFRREISFFSVVRKTFTLSLKKNLEAFSEQCKVRLRRDIDEISHERASHILDGIRQFGDDLTQDLQRIPKHNIKSERFSIKVLERRQDLLENIKKKVGTILDEEGLVQSLNAGVEGAALGTGGALAVISIVVAQVIELVAAQFAFLAVEAAFAGIGIIFFAAGFAWQRHKIVKKFDQALDDGKTQLEIDISQRLNEKLSIIYDDLERECSKFYQDVEQEAQEIVPLLELYSAIRTDSEQLFSNVSELLSEETSHK